MRNAECEMRIAELTAAFAVHSAFRIPHSALRRGVWLTLLAVVAGLLFIPKAWAKYEREQLQLETQIQERIERILAKTLPPASYLVTVKVEMDEKATPQRQAPARKSTNPFLDQNRFVLPGVPQKKGFSDSPEGAEPAGP